MVDFKVYFLNVLWVECFTQVYMFAAHTCLVPDEARRGRWIPETGVTDSCLPPHRCWETHPGPLQVQQAFLTTESYVPPAPGLI